jgi:taurine dehydrogenase small subunit
VRSDPVALNRATVLQQFRGFVHHDLDVIMNTFADDCFYDEHHGRESYGRRFVGKETIRRAFAAIFARAPRCTFRDPIVVVEGDRAVAKWTFVFSEDLPSLAIEGIDLFELRDGKVVEKQSFLKTRRLPLRVVAADLGRRLVARFR